MLSFLQIKIYRGKFIAYSLFVLLIGIILAVMTCAVLLQQWVENVRNEVSNVFAQVNNNLQYDVDRIEAFMQRIYSNSGLMADVRYFLGNSAEGYLTSRLQDSRYNQPLISFPEDIKSFLSDGGLGDIVQVSLHTVQEGNVVRFDKNGNTSFQFRLPNEHEAFYETIQKGFVYRKKLSNPNQISNQLGEFRFLIGSEKIFSFIPNDQLYAVAAVKNSNDLYLATGRNNDLEQLVHRAAADNRSHGLLSNGYLNHAFFVTQPSTMFDYQLVSIVDLTLLVQQKKNTIILVLLIVLAAMISVMLLIIYNLREDAHFLQQIIHTIARVKNADFIPIASPRYRRYEYGMIAKELDEMRHQLDKHIRIEYLLKLEQQQTEMKALQNQINPHFLYNTLEIIRSFSLMNRANDTADAIAALGGLYRGIVKNENIITIKSELDLLQKYLEIMEFKYPDQFYYQFNVDETLLSLPTVKFWMQPLAENFFIHGFQADHHFNLLIVNGFEKEHHIQLEIVDNGKHIANDHLAEIQRTLVIKQDNSSTSIGLRNVYTRLLFFYGNNFTMTISNNEQAGVKVSITISKEAIKDVQTTYRG
ncbi:sensor histidine kinase [Paenibacillus yanchengensis]|uniref:Sensor histidine kinase n=1 Tax=Paenibacillus yanchengensis TaxID=2035833 RepID=A0ABW4YP36_9BACL